MLIPEEKPYYPDEILISNRPTDLIPPNTNSNLQRTHYYVSERPDRLTSTQNEI